MRIISAKDYGFRKVFKVVANPGDSKWLHEEAIPPDAPEDTLPVRSPAPPEHTGDTEEAREPGRQLCHACRLNWRVYQLIFAGDDPRTQEEQLEAVKAFVDKKEAPIPPDLPELVGLEL